MSSQAGPSHTSRRPPIVQPRTVITAPPSEPALPAPAQTIHYNAWGKRPARDVDAGARPSSARAKRFISLREEAAMTDEERKKLNRPFQKSVWQTWKAIPPRRRTMLALAGLATCYLELYVFHSEDDLEAIRSKPKPQLFGP